ncbi:Nicotinamidase [Lachnellula hyalina]|uniref:nicotinamidase n=1 Tax=Lachnellula hyalina TaxID=1316788 RepID=A0A8H8TX83_9HELO|nr:Nicotinamidase [Lachnellula hyalina]TVY24055.1 Nicotinamidase [Lachnellula hyalina]
MANPDFKSALIIVDVQEDFCPPNGTLAVPNARSIIPTINHLLALPFPLKVATKDWHPANHTSFSSTHPGTHPFTSTTTITTPIGSYETKLWPDHCIQGTPGAELLPSLSLSRIDRVVEKGQRQDIEMYSAFYDPHKCVDSGLKGILEREAVTDVFVVGLAFDYCVRATAVDAAAEGFRTWVVGEATRAVDAAGWDEVVGDLKEKGVQVVSVDGEEVARVTGGK